jgi:hypothetical protein
MALVTNKIPIGEFAHLPQPGRAMDVVAITALHQPFVYPMVKGLAKIRLGRRMTAITELRLALYQEALRFLGVVRGMTIQTTHVAAGMRGLSETGLLMFLRMAAQATRGRFLSREILEAYDLAYIAAASHVLRTGAVTGFASVSIVECGFKVRCVFKGLLVEILVAGLAGIRADVLCAFLLRSRRRLALLRCRGQHREKQNQSRSLRKGGSSFAHGKSFGWQGLSYALPNVLLCNSQPVFICFY